MSEDSYSICPYDKNHEILTFRLPAHILKCRKNYHGPPLSQCMYNATHLMTADKLKLHHQECPDGFSFNAPKYVDLA